MAEMEATTRTNRLAQRIQASLAGRASKQVTVRGTLTGPAAEMWAALREEGKALGMEDTAILAALLDAGGVTLRKALRAIPR
jgi:hypothetical protein